MQCKSYFPGYYSTRDLNLEVNGSAFPFNNIDKILNNGHYCPGSLSSPSPDLHLGCNKEALKQTMLKHESIFRDQVCFGCGFFWVKSCLLCSIQPTILI